jgi:hypothetical protein
MEPPCQKSIFLLVVFFLVGQFRFPGMLMWLDLAPSGLSSEDITLHSVSKVLMEVDDNSALIVGNPKGILCQQPKPHYTTLKIFLFLT